MRFTKSITNFTDTEKLLYLIWQELQKSNGFLLSCGPKTELSSESVSRFNLDTYPVPVKKANRIEKNADKATNYDPKNRSKLCKKCGKKFTAWGDFIKHMQEHAMVTGKE